MKIIKPSVEEFIQGAGFEGMLKHIERCGRLCYKSEDRITEGSAEKFVNMLRSHAHGAMLEHGTVYLTVPVYPSDIENDESIYSKFNTNPYSKVNLTFDYYDTKRNIAYITTNYRVIVENGWEDIMQEFQSECTGHHYKRRTFKITCNRGVSHEFVRHRVFSFAQESQRYVNYSKDKFGKEIKVIKPLYFEENSDIYNVWKDSCYKSEASYFWLIEHKATPQEAREVLPNSTATELIMTGFESDWEHFFNLRCAKDAHPQAREVANMIRKIYFHNKTTEISLNFCEQCPKFEARKKITLAQSDSVFDAAVDIQDFVLDCQKTCSRIGVNKDE